MKKSFYGSLCHKGIRGGAIFITDNAIIYKNQTLTLPDEYKNIIIPFCEIKEIKNGWTLLFPAIIIYLKNQNTYKFIIFNRNKFLTILKHLL